MAEQGSDADAPALRLDSPDPRIDAGLALLELAPRLMRLENLVLGELPTPLTFRQYRILERVSQGHTTITALGRLATITLPAVSESVEVLVRKDLVERTPSTKDRRESNLTVTEEGKAALVAARTALDELAAALITGVSARRHPALARDARTVGARVTEELHAFRDRQAEQGG